MKKKPKVWIDYDAHERLRKEHEKSPVYRKAYEAEELMYRTAEMFKEERHKHHFTQKKLAQRSGLKQQEISRIEKGDSNTTIKTLLKIAQGMGKTLEIKIS